jgi:hypothetical protein
MLILPIDSLYFGISLVKATVLLVNVFDFLWLNTEIIKGLFLSAVVKADHQP